MENTCKKCGETKDISLFAKNKGCKIGVESTCKGCRNLISKKWRENNPEEMKERSKKWREANPEKQKGRSKKWREANPEKAKETNKKWRVANSEKEKVRRKKWKGNNPEKLKTYARAAVESLKPFHVSKLLRLQGFKKEQITDDLIQIKTIIIKTKRLCKTSQT